MVNADVVFERISASNVIIVRVLARQMTPPAWSSLPEMGLNFTSTKPSWAWVVLQADRISGFTSCLSTFGLLGAVSSFSTVHLLRLPVFVVVQPGGAAPGGPRQLIVPPNAAWDSKARSDNHSGVIFCGLFVFVASAALSAFAKSAVLPLPQ